MARKKHQSKDIESALQELEGLGWQVEEAKGREFEVEVKHNWKGREFPFDTVHFSNRKRKFALPDNTTWFVMLNHERTHGLMIADAVFLNAPIVEKNTVYTQKEQFVQINVDQGILITFREGGFV